MDVCIDLYIVELLASNSVLLSLGLALVQVIRPTIFTQLIIY